MSPLSSQLRVLADQEGFASNEGKPVDLTCENIEVKDSGTRGKLVDRNQKN